MNRREFLKRTMTAAILLGSGAVPAAAALLTIPSAKSFSMTPSTRIVMPPTIDGTAPPTPPDPPPATLAPPTAFTGLSGNLLITLNWTPSSPGTTVTQQRLYRATAQQGTTSAGIYQTFAGNTAVSYSDTGVANGTNYFYALAAFDGAVEARHLEIGPFTPAVPGILTVNTQSVTVNWMPYSQGGSVVPGEVIVTVNGPEDHTGKFLRVYDHEWGYGTGAYATIPVTGPNTSYTIGLRFMGPSTIRLLSGDPAQIGSTDFGYGHGTAVLVASSPVVMGNTVRLTYAQAKAQWELNMTTWGSHHAADQLAAISAGFPYQGLFHNPSGGDNINYDTMYVWQGIDLYTNNTGYTGGGGHTWQSFATLINTGYHQYYDFARTPAGGGQTYPVVGSAQFYPYRGFALYYSRFGGAANYTAVTDLMMRGGWHHYPPDPGSGSHPVTWPEGQLGWQSDVTLCRELAYTVMATLNAEQLGVTYVPQSAQPWTLTQWYAYRIRNLLDILNIAFRTTHGQYTFMAGLCMRALIEYDRWHPGDTRILPAVKSFCDWMMAPASVTGLAQDLWMPSHQTWRDHPYLNDRHPVAVHGALSAPAFLWVYYKTGEIAYRDIFDQAMSGLVQWDIQQDDPRLKQKEFNQTYSWSIDAVGWRTAGGLPGEVGTPEGWDVVQRTDTAWDNGYPVISGNTIAFQDYRQQPSSASMPWVKNPDIYGIGDPSHWPTASVIDRTTGVVTNYPQMSLSGFTTHAPLGDVITSELSISGRILLFLADKRSQLGFAQSSEERAFWVDLDDIGTITMVPIPPGDDGIPDNGASISGRMTARTARSTGGGSSYSNVWIYDIDTEVQTQINTGNTSKYPTLRGTTLTWSDEPAGDGNFSAYQIDIAVTTNGDAATPLTGVANGGYPADGEGDWSVFFKVATGKLMAINTDTAETFEIATQQLGVSYLRPRMSGTKVVYMNISAGVPCVFVYDLIARTETLVATNARFPTIDNDVIVFQQLIAGKYQIMEATEA